MSETAPTHAYLVQVVVKGFGGTETVVIDAFPAATSDEALHAAQNVFYRAPPSQAIVYGETIFYPDVITSVEVKVLGIVDLSHPDNLNWKKSVMLYTDFLKQMEAQSED
jgi:hypothetical protein